MFWYDANSLLSQISIALDIRMCPARNIYICSWESAWQKNCLSARLTGWHLFCTTGVRFVAIYTPLSGKILLKNVICEKNRHFATLSLCQIQAALICLNDEEIQELWVSVGIQNNRCPGQPKKNIKRWKVNFWWFVRHIFVSVEQSVETERSFVYSYS